MGDVLSGDLLDEPDLGRAGDDGDGVEQATRRRAQATRAREHGVPNGGRDVPALAGQHLGHEERVSAGRLVEAAGRLLGATRELLDPFDRERLQRHSRGDSDGKIPEELTERVARADLVVAERQHEERRSRVDPASEVLQSVQCRLVGPLHVLEDSDRRVRSQFVEECSEVADTLGVGCRLLGAEALESADDVVHGAERARREQCLARPPCDADLVLVARGERSDERRLADARLAADEHDAAGAEARTLQVRVELRARLVSLEQVVIADDRGHDRIVANLRILRNHGR